MTHRRKAPNIQRFLTYLRAGQEGFPPLWNDLQPAAEALEPTIGTLCQELQELGGVPAMTGSGSVVFALFGDDDAARSAASELARRRPDAWVRTARTLARPEVEAARGAG